MLCSVIIPSRDCVTFLPHSVQSILDQTHKDFELIIVNDGSKDKTEKYLKWLGDLNDSRIRIIRTAGIGRSAARNTANAVASGKLIFVLDADDLATPNRLELSIKKYNTTGAQFLYGSATVIDCIGRKLGEIRADVFDKERALATKLNHIVHSSVFYTKEFIEKYPYREGRLADLGLDDWAQQIEAALSGVKMDFVPQTICAYRHLDSAVSKTRDEEEVRKAKQEFLDGMAVGFGVGVAPSLVS